MDAWMIEKLEQEKQEQDQLQVPLYLPLVEQYQDPGRVDTPEEETDRGVCVIEIG